MGYFSKKGVTLVELSVIIGILIVLVAFSTPVFIFFQKRSALSNSSEEMVSALRAAQNKTLASEGASQYGVYFDSLTSPHQYILFKGSDFASRDSSFDKVYQLPKTLEIYQINLGGVNEVVFERLTGITNQSGDVSLRLKSDITKTRTIYIEGSGQVSFAEPVIPADSRVKDSRHLHFDYSRIIDTSFEKITLTFNSTVNKEIVISENLETGQIYWEGEVDISGDVQKIKIHTHRLNNPDTQFCVHRDRRYNDKSLEIFLSGDGSGSIVEYSADGLTTTFNSIYVSNLIWQ